MGKRGQQEIAGFVIIVVLVVIAALIFLVISLGNNDRKYSSVEAGNVLEALWEHTTECVLDKPLPSNVGDLIENAYTVPSMCENLGISSRDYLDNEVERLMEAVLRMETRFDVYQIDVYDIDGNSLGIYYEGTCGDKEMVGADRIIPGKLQVLLRVCLNSDD